LLRAWIDRLPRGRALDLACGTGRNALFLAEHGYQVDALDVAAAALAQGRRHARDKGVAINWVQADLDSYPLPASTYDVIVVCHYLINRAQAPSLARALRRGGMLLYEHHLLAPEAVDGPPREKYRFKPQELRHLFPQLRTLHYEEGLFEAEGQRHALARLVAVREGAPAATGPEA